MLAKPAASAWQPRVQKAGQEKLNGLKLQQWEITKRVFHQYILSYIASLQASLQEPGESRGWTGTGNLNNPAALWYFHTPLVINSSTSVPIPHAALLYDKKRKDLKQKRHFGYAVVTFKVCSAYNKVQNRQCIELSSCGNLDSVLEVFGDVVVGLGVLQEFYESIRRLFHQ